MAHHTIVDTFFLRHAHCLEAFHVSKQDRHPFEEGVRPVRIKTRRTALDPLPPERPGKIARYDKVCANCSRPFPTSNKRRIYCTVQCRQNKNWQRHSARKSVQPAHYENLKSRRNEIKRRFANDEHGRVPTLVGRPAKQWVSFVRTQLQHIKQVRKSRSAYYANLPTPFGPPTTE